MGNNLKMKGRKPDLCGSLFVTRCAVDLTSEEQVLKPFGLQGT